MGAYLIELDKFEDDRGFFARFYCKDEFAKLKLDTNVSQMNNSLNKYKGTLRGIHYQLPPKAETKIVRCIKGSLWDVALDLRKDSPTFGQWHGEKLSDSNRKMMYIPKGFGHAFVTLEDDTELIYLATETYSPDKERIVRWDDSKFSIDWPIEPTIISDKDKSAKDYKESYHLNIND